VEEVLPGAPAARAGLKPGEVILSQDGKAVHSYPELRKEVEAHRIGDSVELEVKREGTVIRFRLVLEEMPAESSQ
jgi:S1-C subfamily serine protease